MSHLLLELSRKKKQKKVSQDSIRFAKSAWVATRLQFLNCFLKPERELICLKAGGISFHILGPMKETDSLPL